MNRKGWTRLAATALVAGSAFFGWLAIGARAKPKSVILITIDTLRADHLSLAGYPRNTSPRIDAFAKRGTWFEWAFSTCSYTLPSHASMMVGMYPSFHSVSLLNGALPLQPDELTLASICKASGLKTAAVVSNFVLRRDSGIDRGFDTYDDRLPDVEAVRQFPERKAAHAVDAALAQIESFGDERFFLWLHIQDPHGPYTPPSDVPEPPLIGDAGSKALVLPVGSDQSGYKSIPLYQVVGGEREFEQYQARYDREIAAADRELGRLFDALEQRGLMDSTLVALTADHGEALGGDDFYFAHSHSVSLGQVHVPLVLVGPGVKSGVSIHEPVTNLGVFATILDFLELPVPLRSQSHSLLATAREGAPVPDEPMFSASISQRGIIYEGTYLRTDRISSTDKAFWKVNPLTQSYFAPLGTEAWSLKGAKAEKIEPPPEVAKRLAEFSVRAEASLRRFWPNVDMGTMDESVRERLRALGYAK